MATQTACVPDDLADVVARLKVDAESMQKEDESNGFKSGEQWAKHRAGVTELKRLKTYFASNEPLCLSDDEGEQVAAAELHRIITGQKHHDFEETREFFSSQVGDNREEDWDNCHFANGFAKGALSIWAKVEQYVEK